jgi:hypothetical protein
MVTRIRACPGLLCFCRVSAGKLQLTTPPDSSESNTRLREKGTISNELQFSGADAQQTYIELRRTRAGNYVWRKPMTKIKTLTAVMILSTAVATPVFAKGNMPHNETLRRAYDQVTVPSFGVAGSQSERNIENFGFSGIDHSFPGGRDPSLNPSGS